MAAARIVKTEKSFMVYKPLRVSTEGGVTSGQEQNLEM